MRAEENVRDFVKASKELIDLKVIDMDVVAIFEVFDRVSTTVELLSSGADREVAQRFDVMVFKPKRTYGRFEHRYFVVGMAVGAPRERRDRDDLLTSDFLPVHLAIALDDRSMIAAAALIVVGGPAKMIFAVAPFARNPHHLAWHTAAFDATREVVASDTGSDDEPGPCGHRLFQFQQLLKMFHFPAADRPDEHARDCDEVSGPFAFGPQLRVRQDENVKVFWISTLLDPATVTIKTGHC